MQKFQQIKVRRAQWESGIFDFIKQPKGKLIFHQKKYSREEVFVRLGVIFVVMILAFLNLFMWIYNYRINAKINFFEKKLEELRRINARIQIETSKMENLDRLYQIATTNLNLKKPEKIEYIFVN